MRIHLAISHQGKIIPFSHQHLLTGVIHKWLGQNEYHGDISLYSFSLLEGLTTLKQGFKPGKQTLSMFISAYHDEFIKQIITGIRKDNSMFSGLSVTDIFIQENPDLSNQSYFFLASPILIKLKTEDKIEHILFENPIADELLTRSIFNKMASCGIEDESLKIEFDKSYNGAKSKLIDYDGIGNRASFCPITINANPTTKAFIWNVGVGNSTGVGFGALK